MDNELINSILSTVGSTGTDMPAEEGPIRSNLTEFIGTGTGDTIGLVIANLDYHIRESIDLAPQYRSIGIVSSRTGGAPHVMAADEAVKATNTIIKSVEFCRDTKGGAGHGSTIIFASEDVADSRRAVEVMLSVLDRQFMNVYGNDAGHIELHASARASYALEAGFGAPVGKAFGITVGAPAAIGMLMADAALKTADVDLVSYSSPQVGTRYSNEIIITFSGDSGAVRQAVDAAGEVGMSLLGSMGSRPQPTIPHDDK